MLHGKIVIVFFYECVVLCTLSFLAAEVKNIKWKTSTIPVLFFNQCSPIFMGTSKMLITQPEKCGYLNTSTQIIYLISLCNDFYLSLVTFSCLVCWTDLEAM